MPDTILVVDDEEKIRRTLSGVLADEGYEVMEAADGRTALSLVDRQVPRLAIVPFEFGPRAGTDEQRVDLTGRIVDVAGADRLEDATQLRCYEAEFGGFLPGRLAPAGAAQHHADGRSPLVSLGRDVAASPVLAWGEQVHQFRGYPDHDIHVTVEIHLTSYISAPRVVTVK